ncbi:MAG: YhbY family RNA-binding protein [Polyangiaceae bacterium]
MPKSPPPRRSRTSPKPVKKPVKKSVLRETHKKTAQKAKPIEHKLLTLTGRQRTFRRGLAHNLDPVLQLGKSGASRALLSELGRALDSHELIKVRVLRECPEELDEIVATIEKQLKANVVGKLGRILVLYRRNPTKLRIMLPQVKKGKSATVTVEVDNELDETEEELEDDLDDDDFDDEDEDEDDEEES